MTEQEKKNIHELTFKNKQNILLSETCQCLYCGLTYSSKDITDFCEENDGQETGICPCLIDSLVPNNQITLTKEQLKEMHEYLWGPL